jgi:hypothetical protein
MSSGTAPRVNGWRAMYVLTFWPVEQALRVDTAGVEAMATRWGASVGDLDEAVAPAGLGLSCQVSAAAVNAAHVDVAAFTAGLAARVGEHASGVAQADTRYLAQEAASSTALAAVFEPVISV